LFSSAKSPHFGQGIWFVGDARLAQVSSFLGGYQRRRLQLSLLKQNVERSKKIIFARAASIRPREKNCGNQKTLIVSYIIDELCGVAQQARDARSFTS
jgi:hypothetical protein